ncbi:MAG: PAS domain S-box protein [Desulfobacterales bacterium]
MIAPAIKPNIGVYGPHYTDMIDSFPDPCFAIDLQGKVIAWNRAIVELTGIEAVDMIDKGDYEYAIPFYSIRRPILIDLAINWDEDAAKRYKYVRKNNDTLVSEVEGIFIKQKLFYLWNTSWKLYDINGNCIGAIEVIRDITEIKRAKEVYHRYDLLKEESRDIILFVDPEDGHILEANDAAFRTYGYSHLEFSSMSIMDLRVPSERNLVLQQMTQAKNKGIMFETVHRNRDGRTFPVEVSSKGAQVGNSKILISIVRDITKRKKADKALKQSEEKFSKAFHNSPSFLFITDYKSGEYIEVNKAYCDLTGYSAEELIGKTSLELGIVKAEHRAEMISKLNDAGKLENYESFIIKKSGEIRSRILSLALIELQGKRCIIASGVDITVRKQTEQALRESENRLRMVVENSWDGIHQLDLRTGQYVFMSPSQERLTGFKTEELMLSMEEAAARVHPGDREFVKNYLKRIISGERPKKPMEYRWQVKSGEYRWFSDNRQAVFGKNRKVVALVGITRDITEIKQIQAELEKSKTELEKKVADRTRLAEARAKQLQALASELLEAEERERRRIAELLHDDLQQMLAAARMQLEWSSRNLPPEPLLVNVGQLLEECIEKSRYLSHELSPVVLHHSGLVSALQWLARQYHEQFGLQVDLESNGEQQFETTHLKVFLFRAVQELLFNVVKHSGVKSARVVLFTSDNCLGISVSDKGRGFNPDILNHSSLREGLGLLSLRERARYIGGNLAIESVPGKRSCFTLTVPFHRYQDETSQGLKPLDYRPCDAPAKRVDPTNTSFNRVLFVDDHQVMRQGLIKLCAGQPGLRVVGEAANGREAIRMAHKLKADIVVMDVCMPEMDGIEATRRIKAELPDVRIIGLSMSGDEHITRAMLEAGAEAFVSKTASSAELIKAIYAMTRSEQNSFSKE